MIMYATSNILPKAQRGALQAVCAATGKTKVKATQFKVGSGKASTTVQLGFTKGNELFVGRMAMLGFGASLVGEILTGQGALGQLGLETGISNIYEIDGIVGAVALFNIIAALFPASGKFVPEEDFSDRKPGSLQDPSISMTNPKQFFGVTGFGFTKENELFVGRMAQLGFAFSLIGETFSGKGPLAQFGFETGIPITQAEPLLLVFIAFTFLAAINEGTGKFIKDGKK